MAVDESSSPGELPPGRSRLWPFALGGVLIGILAVLGVAALIGNGGDGETVDGDPSGAAPGANDPATVESYLDAWFRYRTATLAITWDYERERTDGERLVGTAALVQDPPNRLFALLGSVTGVRNGRLVNCAPSADVMSDCVEADSSSGYRDRMVTEQRIRATYVSGPTPRYRVSAEGPCFEVTATDPATTSPWGRQARFCFDPANGALTDSEIDYGGIVQRMTATNVSVAVTDADFEALLPTDDTSS